MDFKFAHNSITVLDLERSIAFYQKALGLQEVSRRKSLDGQATLARPRQALDNGVPLFLTRQKLSAWNLPFIW